MSFIDYRVGDVLAQESSKSIKCMIFNDLSIADCSAEFRIGCIDTSWEKGHIS